MHYTVSNPAPQSRYFQVTIKFEVKAGEPVEIRLSNWRPGRYELGNFAKYVRDFRALDEQGNEISFDKVKKNAWQLHHENGGQINIQYQYWGYGIDAGSSFCANELLYINPVNCMMYRAGMTDIPSTLTLDIPDHWKIACALPLIASKTFAVADFHTLADSPIIASPHLEHSKVNVDGAHHHFWIHGQHSMNVERFSDEVARYTREQVAIFGEFPATDFHYLIHFLPHQFRHGVEHSYSTVIVNGPGMQFHEPEKHNDMLAICSHELFHFWNVKRLRPAEMWPYDYESENYARTGYIYEGITTYYGDYILLRCGVFDFNTWAGEFNKDLKRHFENEGRFHYSVAESSYDTWLDGYATIAPARKTSIYVEGMLGALMLDIELRRQSQHAITLDTYMQRLYHRYYKQGRGYAENDLVAELSELAGRDMRWFFERFYWGKGEIEKALPEYLAELGLELRAVPAAIPWERYFGMRLNGDGRLVTLVMDNSPAARAGIAQGDMINFHLSENESPAEAIEKFRETGIERIAVSVQNITGTTLREIFFDDKTYLPHYQVVKMENANDRQQKFFERWSGLSIR